MSDDSLIYHKVSLQALNKVTHNENVNQINFRKA